MMEKCPHCGKEYSKTEKEDDLVESVDVEEDFGERIAQAVVKELKRNSRPKVQSSFEDDEEKWPA